MKIQGFDEFIADYPVFEYRIIDTQQIQTQLRVRQICERECERYGSTWACPPGVGTLEECENKIKSYPYGILFSSVAEVSDIMNMEELLSTRREHEDITNALGDFLKSQGRTIFTLSTESCDICSKCTYPNAPCRHPDRMHPCLESYGVVVSELVEREHMEYQLGANTILWFSLILIS